MVLYATVVIRGLYLYNSSNIKYISCNKPFKAFLERQMFKDKPTPLLAIKMWNFYTTLMQQLHCVKRVRIRSYSGLQFSLIFPYSVQMQENAGKMRTRITRNTDTLYAVLVIFFIHSHFFLYRIFSASVFIQVISLRHR